MITPAVIAISLFAASLPVLYLVIIHRSLSGAAANDPEFDVDAPGRSSSTARPSGQGNSGSKPHSGATPKHA